MTTVTLGLGGLAGVGGAGLAAAAVAGAVGLGVLGAAALASRGGGNRRRGGRKRHRGRRSVEEESAAVQRVMDLIRAEDVTGCGMRYVCEMATLDPDTLLEEEHALLDLVGPVVKPGEGLLPPGGAGDYQMAKSVGHSTGACGKAYPMCPLTGTQLMDTVMAYLP